MFRASTTTAQDLLKKGFPQITTAGGTYVLVPDSANESSPMANIKVRQAVSYAIDREAIATGLGFGMLKPAYQIYPGNPIVALPEGQYLKTEYNPTKAKQLLTEAGYPNGFSMSIHTFVRVINKDFITAIAKMLKDVGITCDPDFPEAGKYEEYRSKGWSNGMLAHALGMLGSNPSGFGTSYFPESNISLPSTRRPAGYYDLATASLTSPTVDTAKVQALSKLMADNFMVVPYAEEKVSNFYARGAHDVGGEKFLITNFVAKYAWLEASAR
jgi:ABC-type transport system substrate-binding protein